MLVFLRLDPSAPPAEPGGLVMVILGKCGDLALLLIIAIGVSVWLGPPKHPNILPPYSLARKAAKRSRASGTFASLSA